MFTPKHTFIASIIAVFTAFHPHISSAEIFKGSDFLTWKPAHQQSYIEITVGTAGLIAARNKEQHAKCIESWYYNDQDAGNAFILTTMEEHPEYHPRGVIIAVLEKKCGSFSY